MQYKTRAKEFGKAISPRLEKRKEESERMLRKHSDKIPVLCEKAKGSSLGDIDKTKYLVPKDVTVHQLTYIIRKRLRLPKDQSLWLYVNGKHAIKGDTLMAEVYEALRDPDGFLYIVYTGENVFGHPL